MEERKLNLGDLPEKKFNYNYAVLNSGLGQHGYSIIRHNIKDNLVWEVAVPDAGSRATAILLVELLNAQGSEIGQSG